MRKVFVPILAACLVLPGCATIQRATATVAGAINAVEGVRGTVAEILDRPAPLANTERDEALIRSAYTRFDQALSIIETLVDRRVITPGSPTALRIDGARVIVQRELRRAYTAQQALNTGTVRDALGSAQLSLTAIISNLRQEQ